MSNIPKKYMREIGERRNNKRSNGNTNTRKILIIIFRR